MTDQYAHLTEAERALLKLTEAATPGPWSHECFAVYGQNKHDRITHTGAWSNLPPSRSHECENNAAFIAASRTAVPALLTEVSRLRAALREARWHFLDYATQHKAKGTPDGDMKAAVNASRAADCERAFSPAPAPPKE